MKRVSVEAVSRVFGRTFALHRVSLNLPAGAVTALVGDNGAGKTTLLNILATLDAPTEGAVRYGDYDWATFSRRGRGLIGWVSHDALVYGDLTGRENLVFFARMYGLDDPGALADQWLERIGLGAAADRRVHAYSRGMKQRLTLARALLHDPRVVLLDEPMTGLDQAGRRFASELFGTLRDQGKVVALVTHNLRELDGLADRMAVLRRGRLTFVGEVASSDDVLAAYREYA